MTTSKRPRTNASPPETNPGHNVSPPQPSHSGLPGESELPSFRAFCLVGTQRAGDEHKQARRREVYDVRADLDGCTAFPFQEPSGPQALADQRRQNKANVGLSKVYRLYGCRTRSVGASLKRQNKANVSLGKMYGLIPNRISADIARTNPFFTQSSQSSRRLADPAIRPGRNRANEPIAVIAIGRDADWCSPGMPVDRRNEANVNLDRICRLAANDCVAHRSYSPDAPARGFAGDPRWRVRLFCDHAARDVRIAIVRRSRCVLSLAAARPIKNARSIRRDLFEDDAVGQVGRTQSAWRR